MPDDHDEINHALYAYLCGNVLGIFLEESRKPHTLIENVRLVRDVSGGIDPSRVLLTTLDRTIEISMAPYIEDDT